METPVSNQEIKDILLETQALVVEANERLKKQEAKQKRDFWIKLGWSFVVFVLPIIIIYVYVLPMFESLYAPLGGESSGQFDLNQAQELLETLQQNRQ